MNEPPKSKNNSSKKISLENFDTNKKKIRITSPHSILACEIMGIKLDELAYLTYEEYLKKNPEFKYLDETTKLERYEHHQARREKLITSLREKRNYLIEKENETNTNITNINDKTSYGNLLYRNDSYNNFNFNKTHFYPKTNLRKSESMGNINDKNKNSLMLNEEEKFKKFSRRQKINMKLQIDYKLMQERIRLKTKEKMKLKSENDKMMKLKKQDELMQKKMKEEMREMEQKQRLENYRKNLEKKRKDKTNRERIKMINEQKRKDEEERQRKIKFDEQEKKEKEIRDKANENNKILHQELLRRQNELNKLDKKRRILLEQKKEERSKQINEKAKELQDKINYVLGENERIKEEKIMLYYQKQKKMEEYQKQKEMERNLEQINKLQENQKKLEKIQSILRRNKKKQEEKIKHYLNKNKIKHQNQILRHQKELKLLEKKKQENEDNELKVQKNRELYLNGVENKKKLLLQKIDNNDKRIKKQKLEQEKKLMEKNNQLYMQREDRKLKIEQSQRANKFQRDVLYSQIKERMEKVDDFINDKILIGEKRKQMEKKLTDEKEGMEDRLQKIMKQDEYLPRNEILNYVLNDKKPNLTNNKNKSQISETSFEEIENKNKSKNKDNYGNDRFDNINYIKIDFKSNKGLNDNLNPKLDIQKNNVNTFKNINNSNITTNKNNEIVPEIKDKRN